ncbi:MAG: hypothetical protein AAF703_18935 [Cyanobacteria bacterium P01_D01_bin.105]
MTYNTQTRTTGVDRAITGLFVAGVTFVLGYTVVRASLAESAQQTIVGDNADIEIVIPGEGTLWADFGKSF